ncbi:hypothetical protein WDW89_21810 [Deltaproteobacteria bacterium TL4]
MSKPRILLTTPTYPYPTLPANESLTDAMGQRFTKGDGLFTIVSHTHCYANHILAQNIEEPSTLLEYPRWEDFTAEIDKGYAILGISAFPVHLEQVLKMCAYVRQNSPSTQILLGSYAAQAFNAMLDPDEQKRYVDHVIQGEGVCFLRKFLGEDPERPIRQHLMPKGGGAPRFISNHPRGNVAFLVSGLGCPGGCDFCSSSEFFKQKRIEFLSPDELVAHIHQYHQVFPEVSHVFVIEEDHFRHPRYLIALKAYWEKNPSVVESIDWFAFGSVDHIGKFAKKYGWDTIAEIGIGAIFIGVESKFAGEHGYDKRSEYDPKEVFRKLHLMGIRTVGAWMCGWDFHNHANIHEDLNYFVSLYPTYQQLTRVSPFPGTPLWKQRREEGRLEEVPWEDIHFWSGAQKNTELEAHETLNLTEFGYDLLYQTWGPSMLRRLDVELNGYAFCQNSSNPILRQHKSLFFKRQCAMLWTLYYAIERYAPNGVVRRRARKIHAKYCSLIGEPTPVMRLLARSTEVLASLVMFKEIFDPANRHPKEEPYKKYIYTKNQADDHPVPYQVEWPVAPTLKNRIGMKQEEWNMILLANAMKAMRLAQYKKSDPEIDLYFINLFASKRFGFGF